MKEKPYCQTVLPWLKANLGKHCLAPLTSTDAKALSAAVQIIALYACARDQSVLDAFGGVVELMQSSTQHLAYHAIAHVMDWSDRDPIWADAGLGQTAVRLKCAYEPTGAMRGGA